MSFSKFNKSVRFDVDTTNMEYVKISSLTVGKVYPIRAIYINTKGHFDDSPVFVTDEAMVNIPAHVLDAVKQILADVESIEAIKAGHAGFKTYEYTDKKFNKKCFGVEFVDIE